jgi:hypothetical protein
MLLSSTPLLRGTWMHRQRTARVLGPYRFMKVNKTPLTISPAILALNDATSSEKLLLALYAVEPLAKNYRALHVLGVGSSGLKKIKQRLMKKGYLRVNANGHEVSVPGLEPGQEPGGHLVLNSTASLEMEKVAPVDADQFGCDAVLAHCTSRLNLYNSYMQQGHVKTALECAYYAIQRIQECKEFLPEQRDALLRQFTFLESRALALSLLDDVGRAKRIPRQNAEQLAELICRASPEQMEQFRERYEARSALGNPLDILALPSA